MKKLLLVDVNEYTVNLLKHIPIDEVECFLDKDRGGQTLQGKQIFAHINMDVKDIPAFVQNIDVVICSQNRNNLQSYAADFRNAKIPFLFASELLMQRKIYDPAAYPYPIKYLTDTYHCPVLRELTTEEEQELSVLEEAYQTLIVGVIHPTAIGAFAWTFGSFVEYVTANADDRTAVGVCRGDHPLMYTVKKYHVPNEFLYKKYKETYPTINEGNVNLWCAFICRNFDRLVICDYSTAWWQGWHQMRQFYQDKKLEPQKIPPKNRIRFTMEEEKKGAELAHEMGITQNFVCFFSRDSSYIDKTHNLPQGATATSNAYRDSDINRYSLMAAELEKRGIQSVRMGSVVNKAYEGPGVDYSNVGQSDFMDAYLFSKCLFFVNDVSGIDMMPRYLFDKPTVGIVMPSGGLLYRNEMVERVYLMLFYKCKNMDTNRYLTLREHLTISTRSMNGCTNAMEYMSQNNIIMEPIAPENIWEATEEMLNILEGTQKYSQEDYELREKFGAIVMEYLSKDASYSGVYGCPCAGWLRENKWFLE